MSKLIVRSNWKENCNNFTNLNSWRIEVLWKMIIRDFLMMLNKIFFHAESSLICKILITIYQIVNSVKLKYLKMKICLFAQQFSSLSANIISHILIHKMKMCFRWDENKLIVNSQLFFFIVIKYISKRFENNLLLDLL